MGLKADFDEVHMVWKTYPWRLKVWLGLSLFLASGSIASLSETVFRWKSFFLEAMSFYRAWISTPLASLLSDLFAFKVPKATPI
jgi:hypothetical protein